MHQGFIRLNREITQWEFYKKRNIMAVYLHLLLTVAFRDHRSGNLYFKRGTRILSRNILAEELGMTPKEARYALEKLEKAGAIRCRGGSRGTMVEVIGYPKGTERPAPWPDEREPAGKRGPAAGQKPEEMGPQQKKGEEREEAEKERTPLTGGEKERTGEGEFGNVFLTKEEKQSLSLRFGEERTEGMIEEFSAYCKATGKHYADHYAALVSWGKRRQERQWAQKQGGEGQSFFSLAQNLEGERV